MILLISVTLAIVSRSFAADSVITDAIVPEFEIEEDPLPQYKYAYNVQDSVSGDHKGHVEERDGDVVRGEYSLIDADGFKRTVTYTADAIHGFQAAVRREPLVLTENAKLAIKTLPNAVAETFPKVLVEPPAKVMVKPLRTEVAPLVVTPVIPRTNLRQISVHPRSSKLIKVTPSRHSETLLNPNLHANSLNYAYFERAYH